MTGPRGVAHRSVLGALAVAAALAVPVVGPPAGAATTQSGTQSGIRSGRTGTAPPPPAVPHPFGTLSCAPAYGVRLCQGGRQGSADLRVPSFDGVPLDADVALPAKGKGPFPLVVLLHGLGGSKSEFEVTTSKGDGIDDVTLARQGYAVLMYTARGFGESCGTAASRVGTPGCAKGWVRLADQRYEVRDTQYLAGLLVDEGLVKPAIAVSGVSYGAGQSLELAMLKNRMRLPDGRLVPFTSPGRHVAMRVAAVYAVWPWDDLVTALVPNGHLSTAVDTAARADRVPAGVMKQSWDTLLYGVTEEYDVAPPGVDPQSDLRGWFHRISAGEPYTAGEAEALRTLQEYKSAIGVPMPKGGPAPTAIQSGWTDTLFPVSEAEHYVARVEAAGYRTPMLAMFDDVGHGWAQNKPAGVDLNNVMADHFLSSVMLAHHRWSGTRVVAVPQTCPATAPSGRPLSGPTLASLAPHRLVLGGKGRQVVTSSGGDPAVAAALDPAYSSALCDPMPAPGGKGEPGTATYDRSVGRRGVTMIGAAQVAARVRITGRYPEVVGRLWDVSPDGTRQIVAMGVYRPSLPLGERTGQAAGTKGTATATQQVWFELTPNDYRFAAGHTVQLELVGSSAPYFRKSNGTFRLAVTDLTASLPTTTSTGG
ncbi:MAG TPA: CocE/NonD family hydrolase C-terminal non-catalytic domain-containing protein [Acidimicrobiales bacterium]|nr:CocE/NonD family hydrolase C-terminal non-catalytic domain-containing protein [Acidimicrobiales bacterium]